MKVTDILASKKVTVSCELFPPKHGTELEKARHTVAETVDLHPDFISVTYGAAGNTAQFTAEIAEEAVSRGASVVAHLTCVSADKSDVHEYLDTLKKYGVENVLALRGDMPQGREPKTDFLHASDLALEIAKYGDFCIGGACYPEGHPEAPSLAFDIETLKIKSQCGISFFTSQLFFDNEIFYAFLSKLRRAGVDTPVIAGVMPIFRASQLSNARSLSGTMLPRRLREIVERFGDDPAAMRQAGIAYATEQIIDLIANGVNNIHVYTMNRPDIAGCILNNLSEIWK